MANELFYPKNTLTRQAVSLDGMWKFQFDPEGIGTERSWADGLPKPISMPVPSSFNDLFTDKDSREYAGDFWYETEFFVPGEWQEKDLDLRFGAATHEATVYVNGQEVGYHKGGFLPFNASINEVFRPNERNKVVVRLNNELSATTLPVGKTITKKNGKKMVKPFFDFFNYAGLQRSVWLVVTPKESIVDFTVNHFIEGNGARIEYSLETTGKREVFIEVFDEDGQMVAEQTGKENEIWIEDAQLWKPLDAADGKVTGFFNHDIVHTQTKAHHKNDVRELIQRDKNHASVCIWSLLNEPDTLADRAYDYFEEIFDYAHELDVQKRPRTFASIGSSIPGKCKVYPLCDIITVNRYFGWYAINGYELEKAEDFFHQEMALWEEVGKPLIFTEYGADTVGGKRKLPSVMWSEEYQKEYLDIYHRIFDAYDFIVGEQIWNFADFQTVEGINRLNGNKKGIYTRDRQPKAIAYVLKERWEQILEEQATKERQDGKQFTLSTKHKDATKIKA